MISSVTVPSISRVMSSLTRRSSGPTPAIGLIAPPSTWYLPRNSRVRSMATTSLGSSTTQIVSGERRGSRQMRHWGSWATFPQISQNWTRSLTSVSASASRRTSAGSAARRWYAMRWALLGPTPGSRPSSSIRSWTAPSYTPASLRGRGVRAFGRAGDQLDLEPALVLEVRGVVLRAAGVRVAFGEQERPAVLRSLPDELVDGPLRADVE